MRASVTSPNFLRQPRSGERMQPTAQAVGQRQKAIQRRRDERGPSPVNRVTVVGLSLILSIGAHAQVTFERLLNSNKEPQNWLTYSGDYSGKRFSPLGQINASNAPSLTAKWVYQTAATGKLETTPLVVRATGGSRFGLPPGPVPEARTRWPRRRRARVRPRT